MDDGLRVTDEGSVLQVLFQRPRSFQSAGLLDASSEWDFLDQAMPDVAPLEEFLRSCCTYRQLQLGEPDADAADLATVLDGGRLNALRSVDLDSGLGQSQGWVIAEIRPSNPADPAAWADTARRIGKPEWIAELTRALTGHDADVPKGRGLVLISLLTQGGQANDLRELAARLATRAPSSEPVLVDAGSISGISRQSDAHYQITTVRTSGFVIAARAGSSRFFTERFPVEVRHQYTLAALLAVWQRGELLRLAANAQQGWEDPTGGAAPSSSRAPFASRRRTWERFERSTELRGEYARLLATGTFGPVFESTSQARWWDGVRDAEHIERRRQDVEEALEALGQVTETEANLNLDRVLTFFTLVIGIPSLVFTVLGVNVEAFTSDDGLHPALVAGVFLAFVVLGAVAYSLAMPRSRRTTPGRRT